MRSLRPEDRILLIGNGRSVYVRIKGLSNGDVDLLATDRTNLDASEKIATLEKGSDDFQAAQEIQMYLVQRPNDIFSYLLGNNKPKAP